MTKATIKTSVRFGETVVWYLTADKVAVTADVVKDNAGKWVVKHAGRTFTGSQNKAEAVKWAKTILKGSMK